MSDSVKRICHITTVHPRRDIRIFLKECVSLSSVYEVTLVVADGKGNETDNKIKIIDVYNGRTSRLNRILFVSFKAYKMALAIDCDSYHFHDPEFLIYGLLLKLKGKKIIYDVHEDLPRQVMSKGYIYPIFRKPISSLVAYLEKLIARRLTAVITVTPEINMRFSIYNKNSFIISNYPRIEELELTEPKKKSDSEVCYIGGITRVRGLETLIDSLEKTDVTLNLAGNFESDEFKKKLMNKPGWEKVNYLGFLTRKETFEVLSRSIAGLVTFYPEPNHISARPTKLFEYMLAGIPVIASDFPIWKEFLNQNECGISVDPTNPKDISKAIMFFVNNPDLAKKMGENGKKVVLDTYSWKNEEKKLMDIYSDILA